MESRRRGTCSYPHCNNVRSDYGLTSTYLKEKLDLDVDPWYCSVCCCSMHKHELSCSDNRMVSSALKDVYKLQDELYDELFEKVYKK